MTANLSNLIGSSYGLGLAEICFVSVIGAAILYSKHGIGTFGLCVIAAIAGYSGSWILLDLWRTPSLLVCEILGSFFGVATANVWLRLREAQAENRLTRAGAPARPAVGNQV